MDKPTKQQQTAKNEQEADKPKENYIPFPLKNLVGQPQGTIFGTPLSELSARDRFDLERGNYTDSIYSIKYQTADGKTLETKGRLYLAKASNGTVEAKFLQVKEKPDIKEFLQGGYKLKEGERDKLLAGETLAFTNKPLIRGEGGVPVRSEKASEYLAKLDPKTNQVVVRSLSSPKTFKFNTKIYSVDIPPKDFEALKAGKPIEIKDPTFRTGGLTKGSFSVVYDPVRNNVVVKVTEKLKEQTKNKVTKTQEPKQRNIKLSPKPSRSPKI